MILGQVSQINVHDVAITLPNNLTGYLPITAISDKVTERVEALIAEDEMDEREDDASEVEDIELSSLFKVGQYLRTYVTSTGDDGETGVSKGKRRIELSALPKLANSGLEASDMIVNSMVQASVISVEDHGLVMDLGLEESDVKGFMSSKEVGNGLDYGSIQEGAVFLCLVAGVNASGKTVKLIGDLDKAGNIKKTNYLVNARTVDSFLPGTAVEVLVTDVEDNGIVGKVMGMLDVTADFVHSGATSPKVNLASKYKIGNKIKGRITCTFPTSENKKLGISLLPHILSLSPLGADTDKVTKDPTTVLPISSTIEEAKVTKVTDGIGLFLDVGVKGVAAFVHVSRIREGKIETLSEDSGPYRLGSTHRARIIGFNGLDGLFLASMEEKILDQPFLRVEDIPIGAVVKGKVESIVLKAGNVGGVLVNLADGISGLVPEMHMADVKLSHPERKFKEGMAVTARVMSTDPGKRQIRLTLKKSLVNSDVPILKGYEDAAPGMSSPGTLVNILPSGAVVQFYGRVRGFLPVSEMSEAYIKDPTEHFRTGQVINVHVLSVDPDNEKMRVSCKDPTSFGLVQQAALKKLTVGDIVNATVIEKSDDDIQVALEGSELKAVLTVGQLTDGSEKKNASTLNKLKPGQKLTELVVLEKLESKRLIVLSQKPSLVKAAQGGKFISNFENVKAGKTVRGFVRNIIPSGIFVQFGGSLTGLILKHHLEEEAQKLPDFGLVRNQSIKAKVASIDHSSQRFFLSTKDEVESTEKKDEDVPERTAIGAIDGVSTSVNDYVIGKVTKAKVLSVKGTQMNVELADNIKGRIDVSMVFDKWEDIANKKNPLKVFVKDQIIDVKVLGLHDARSHRFLPITHRQGKIPVFELTAKPSDIASDKEVLTLSSVKEGSTWNAFINNYAEGFVWVNLSPSVRGSVKILELSDDISQMKNLERNFPVGSALRVHVVSVDASKSRLDLSARSAADSKPLSLDTLTKGMVVPGRVTKVTDRHIMVGLDGDLAGSIDLIDLADDYSTANPTVYSKNDIVRVCVVDVDRLNRKVRLSTRPSKVLSSSLKVKDPEITSLRELKINDVVRGFINRVSDKGVFVTLGNNINAYVRVSDLSDAYIKDWKAGFEVDQLVKGKVTALDANLNHIQLSLKESVLDKNYIPKLSFTDMEAGQIVTGKVRKVEDFGVFVVVDGSNNVSGLCHKSQLADQPVLDVKKLYDEGDLVKAKVLKVDVEKRRISFGLKASYFMDEEDDEDEDMEDSEGEGVELDNDAESDGSGISIDIGGVKKMNIVDQAEDSSEYEDAASQLENDSDEDEEMPNASNGISLVSAGGFDWSAGEALGKSAEDINDDSDSDTAAAPKKKKKRADIMVDRTGDLDANGPQSTADFERLLLGQPDSSFLWVSYMAFLLGLSEVARAREIAERALKSISQREEAEKVNVWVALLNLENTYGDDESIEEVFGRASVYADALDMYERLASIYIQSGKFDVRSPSFDLCAQLILRASFARYNDEHRVAPIIPAFDEAIRGDLPVPPKDCLRN
jgi:rRNA biogenesis protein RRP5